MADILLQLDGKVVLFVSDMFDVVLTSAIITFISFQEKRLISLPNWTIKQICGSEICSRHPPHNCKTGHFTS